MKSVKLLLLITLLLIYHLASGQDNNWVNNQYQLRTVKVLDYEQLVGKPKWAQENISKLSRAIWNLSSDGTFTFTMPNVRNDLYPIHGEWKSNDDGSVSLEGGSSSHDSVGLAEVQIKGKIYKKNNVRLITMTSSVFWALGATINNQKFSNTSKSSYRFTVEVR